MTYRVRAFYGTCITEPSVAVLYSVQEWHWPFWTSLRSFETPEEAQRYITELKIAAKKVDKFNRSL